MRTHPAVLDLYNKLSSNPDRYAAHASIKERVAELCEDQQFIHEALDLCLEDKTWLTNTENLMFPLLDKGDVIISIHLFVPLRDGGQNITMDNIHHHGWRLLTTGVISGDGYDSINFKRNSHENRDGEHVKLEVESQFHHEKGKIGFVDSFQSHVVFHPKTQTSTLAVWSADKVIKTQGVKKMLAATPGLRQFVVKTIHALRLNNLLGLNPLRGLYYHPYRGKMLETQNYSKPIDGTHEEMLRCKFKFFEQVGYTDPRKFDHVEKEGDHELIRLIGELEAKNPIPDTGIWGDPRRRFTKTQILQALDHSVPSDIAG